MRVHTASAEGCERHLNMREGRNPVANVAERQAMLKAWRAQQQPRHELARGTGVNGDFTAGDAAGTEDCER